MSNITPNQNDYFENVLGITELNPDGFPGGVPPVHEPIVPIDVDGNVVTPPAPTPPIPGNQMAYFTEVEIFYTAIELALSDSCIADIRIDLQKWADESKFLERHSSEPAQWMVTEVIRTINKKRPGVVPLDEYADTDRVKASHIVVELCGDVVYK